MSEENISENTPHLLPRTDFELYRPSRIFYIIESLVEYLVSLTVSGAFIAKVSTELGVSDSLTGIISAIASLGGLFQIIGLFISQKKRVKPFACHFLFIANLFFGLVYVIPLIPIPLSIKISAFAALMVGGYLLRNIIGSPRTRWMMSFIDPRRRGTFNAKKETISLIGGMTYSLLIGSVIDFFESKGDLKTAFLICAIAIFTFSLSDLAMLLLMKEPTDTDSLMPRRKSATDILIALKNKGIWKITAVRALWAAAYYSSIPFLGTYQNKELGFSMTFISVIATLGMVFQACSSIPTGRLGDKYGARTMFTLCLSLTSISMIFLGFTTPANGAIMFMLYTIVFHVGVAGTGFGSISLIYEYSDPKYVTETIAISTAVPGVVGFLSSTAVSRLVGYIQANNNSFLGINVYAQQVLCFISAIIMIIELLYIRFAFKKRKLY